MKYWKNVSRTFLMLLLASAVTACGFHLRGSIPLAESIDTMYLNASSGPFKNQMEDVLLNAGVTLTPTIDSAKVQLNILESIVQKTVGTLDEFGKANSYMLNYRVRYRLETLDGATIRNTTVYDRRQYDFDPEAVLSTESEEQELILEMEESVALQIVRQLSTITNTTQVSSN